MTNQQYSSSADSGFTDRSAPYSEEAEEAVLGAVLSNPNVIFNVSSFLKGEDFYILRHQYIWEAIQRIVERGEEFDYLTVSKELLDIGRLDEVGGPWYLLRLVNNTPTSVHAEVYAKVVERAAVRRRLMTAADEIKALALNEEMAIEKVTDEAEARLFGVTESQLKRDLVPISHVISEYWERMERLIGDHDEALGLPTGFRQLDTLLGGLQKSDLLIFAGRPGMGKCVAEGTLISTDAGLVPIENLKPNDIDGIPDGEDGIFYPLEIGVQTPNGTRQTAYFYDSGIKPTLRITTRAGYSLTGTHVHPVLILSKAGQKVWKNLSDLHVGDFVAINRHENICWNSTVLPDFEFKFYYSNLTSKPQLPKEMTPHLAYILGLLTGDGNLTRKNYVSISSADYEIVEIFYQWASELGLVARHRADYDHTISSVLLNTWLAHIGLSGYAHEKEVPFTILQAPANCVRAFLQGLFDTDAHAELQNGYVQFVTSSERLARQVHILLVQFGIISKLTFKANNYKGAWLIRITGNAARLFYTRIGFKLERKQERRKFLPSKPNSNLDVIPYLPKTNSHFDRYHEYTRYFRGVKSPSYNKLRQIVAFAPEVQDLLEPEFYWDEITQVEDAGLRPCYDLTIPDGHTFVANGIVNHNTSFMLSLALNAARFDKRIAIFTMEMGVEQIIQRMVSMETGINMQRLRLGQVDELEWRRLVEAMSRLRNFKIFIDDTPAMSPMQMRAKCRRLAREQGIDLIMVDYIQLMNAGGVYENNRVQEVSYISRNLKELARELNVPLFSAAQLSRAVEQRQDKRPQMSDLRESGSIEQDSDIVMFLYRDEVYNEATESPNQADIIIAKHRNGPTGVVSLYFDKTITRFMDATAHNIDLSRG